MDRCLEFPTLIPKVSSNVPALCVHTRGEVQHFPLVLEQFYSILLLLLVFNDDRMSTENNLKVCTVQNKQSTAVTLAVLGGCHDKMEALFVIM